MPKRKAEPAGTPTAPKRAAVPKAAAAAPKAAAAAPKAAASSAAAAAAAPAPHPACPHCGKSDEALLECGGPCISNDARACEEATRACQACAKPSHPGGSALLVRCELCDSLYCTEADDCVQSLETCAGCGITHCWRCGDWHVCDKCGDFFCSDCEDLKTSKGGLSECANCQPWYKRGRPATDFCKGCGSSNEDAVLCQKCGKRECLNPCGGTSCGECGSGQCEDCNDKEFCWECQESFCVDCREVRKCPRAGCEASVCEECKCDCAPCK